MKDHFGFSHFTSLTHFTIKGKITFLPENLFSVRNRITEANPSQTKFLRERALTFCKRNPFENQPKSIKHEPKIKYNFTKEMLLVLFRKEITIKINPNEISERARVSCENKFTFEKKIPLNEIPENVFKLTLIFKRIPLNFKSAIPLIFTLKVRIFPVLTKQ